ncbi:hypothetical protein, partial [Actinoplanes sp. NPDC026623]|uniref:hypothetical protein n=1 Tax=Actinoplanes sp. NPDC026623 TaxID=3155610 RepID=UPI0033C40C50
MSDAPGTAPATGPAAGLDQEPMLWLALPPYWTGEAALAAGFPAPRLDRPPGRRTAEDLVAFVTASARQGRAERRGVLTPDAMWTAEFWCPPARRRIELEAAVGRAGRQAVVSEARFIAGLLTRLDLDLPLAPVVQHWARLMLADDADRPDQGFLNTVRRLCRAGRRDEALEHIVAAEALAPIASEPMQEAIEAAHRLVHLANRRSHDRKTLESYQPRPEWSGRLRRLLTSPGSEHWAMHLVGLGGTGKTSFVRYVASGGFAADCALADLTVARVDFDHLSPAYPAQRPVHLLVELADELAQDATAEGERALAAFYQWARRANAAAAEGRETAEPVSRAVEAFAALLRTVPGPALLMLDTCEELSKFDPAGTTDAALETTFDLLARVHAAVPALRVLLSGRRPLSPAGPAWRRLETMPALGFHHAEAIAFLRRGHLGTVMPPDLADAVLALSPELGRPRPGEVRFSPYDLALYWRWWAAEKSITASDLRRSGKAAYVEARIVNRLHGSLTAWLPGVALLGRFDHRTLAGALPERADAAEVVHELARQEWIDTDTDPASRALILEVDAPLRDLLLEWARTCEPALLESSRKALAGALADRTGSLPLEQISTAHVLSALRLATVDEAVLLWERLEARLSDAHDWAWMAQVCPRILGAAREGPDAGTRPDVQEGVAGNSLLVAAVRATAIALGR